jgi:hypothetical protein
VDAIKGDGNTQAKQKKIENLLFADVVGICEIHTPPVVQELNNV